MAKRFLDTNYYKSPFVRGLKGPLKALYSFIICDCDGAGIWNYDLEVAGLYIGFGITNKEFDDAFIKTGKAIPISDARFFFPDFIEHQYPNGLIEVNRAHKSFISILKRYDLIDENLNVKPARGFEGALKELESPIEGASKGLERGFEGANRSSVRGPSIGLGNVLLYSNTPKEEDFVTKVTTTDVAPEEKKVVEVKTETLEDVASFARKNSEPKKKVARKKKGRDPDSEPYWQAERRVWVDFNLKHLHFKVEPIPKADYSFLHRIVEKIRERATDQGVPWTELEAVKRLDKFLTAAYTGDKWLHDHFELKNLTTQMQSIFKLSENGRSNVGVVGKTITFDKP
jgi:hypothetical protein